VSDVIPPETDPSAADSGAPPVQLYWRPGCGFCSSLTRSLDRIGLEYDRHNIWDDEDAAVFVREVANGNETVPTVRVGDVALVNPTAHEVMAEVATRAPARMPVDYEPPEPGALGRALRRMLGG
jgi:mycoredoxin